jgi:hypothetical protein
LCRIDPGHANDQLGRAGGLDRLFALLNSLLNVLQRGIID